MRTYQFQIVLLISLIVSSVSSFSIAQQIDTAYFLSSNQPLTVQIEGQRVSSNSPISRVEKWTNNSDSVFINIYWKYCTPAFLGFEPFDTTVVLDFTLPNTFDLRINSYRDTNSISNCSIRDSVELYMYYDVFNNIATLNEHTLEEKQLIKVVDIMGNETEDKSNELLIYIYSDGTIRKVFRVE